MDLSSVAPALVPSRSLPPPPARESAPSRVRVAARPYARYWVPDLVALLAVTAVTIAVFQFSNLDLEIARRYFQPPGKEAWGLRHDLPWIWLRNHIGLFSGLFGLAAFGAVIAAHCARRFRRLGLYGMLTLATIAVGPGVAVNLVLKPFWGRERPRNVHEFNGRSPYQQALEPGRPGSGHSFPCGHSSIGFALVVSYFILRRRRRRYRFLALAGALATGLIIGYARVIAGAHFASDVVWSGLIVYFVAWLLYYFVLNVPGREDAGDAPVRGPPRWVVWAYGALALCICVGGVLAAPVYHRYAYSRALTERLTPAFVRLSIDRASVAVEFTDEDRLEVLGASHGFGLQGSRVRHRLRETETCDGTYWNFDLKPDGLFTELTTELRVRLPRSPRHQVSLLMEDVALRFEDPAPPPPHLTVHLRGGSVALPATWRPERLHLNLIEGIRQHR